MVKDKIIFIDSDGTVMDSMTLKHNLCFGPALIETYNLDLYKEDILNKWNEINLYSLTRGINRFDGHYMILKYIDAKYQKISFLNQFKIWLDTTKAKANSNLNSYIEQGHKELKPILAWSNLTNEKIVLHQEEVKPFANVYNVIKELAKTFRIVIISSANNKAVMHEWEKFKLLPLVDEVCTQEMGSKSECITKILEQLKPKDAIMLGDAIGDLEAAQINKISFYPIMPLHENESWQDFLKIYSKDFYNSIYKNKENDIIANFYKILKKED